MNIRKILLPALLIAAFSQANGQQRTCDMQVTLLEPAPSAVINAFAQYNIRVNIVNNGPDTLFAGDTLYYNKPSQPLFDYSTYILTQNINPAANLNLTLATLNNVNTDQTDQVMDYYIFVVSNPNDNGRFIDTTNDDNNYDVNTNVTFKAGQPTDIRDLKENSVLMELYPNPATSTLNVGVGPDNHALSLSVSDITGREVLKTKSDVKIIGNQTLDISTMQPGIYMIQVQTDKGRAAGKFIKK